MGQEPSTPTLTSTSQQPQPQKSNSPITPCYEGILKIAKTPFDNCQKIEINGMVYFKEKTKTSLKNLVKSKARGNKYFGEPEVLQIIENILYTLAYLEGCQTPYPFLSPDNVYLSAIPSPSTGLKHYKLLPPSAIPPQQQIYSKLKWCLKQKPPQAHYIPASPQLLIALRCHEPSISQPELLHKSTIFALGLLLLQVCTLRESAECFDLDNWEIVDQVVMERIEEIQGRYTGKVVRIVANMLDYDYEERMMPKEMAVWVNRELNDGGEYQEVRGYGHQRAKGTPSFPKAEPAIVQNTQMIKSRLVEEPAVRTSTTPTKNHIVIVDDSQKKAGISQPRNSQRRLSQIRNKIIKQKIKAQKQTIQQKQLQRSRKHRTSSYLNPKATDKSHRNLPNPYLNHNHINRSSQKSPASGNRPRNPYLPPSTITMAAQHRDLGIHDINKLRPQHRYSYTNQEEELISVSDRDRSKADRTVNLKYRYNMGTDEEGESVRLSSNRKREGERFVRVQKSIAQFTRAGQWKERERERDRDRVVGSGKKYDYGDIMGDVYENRPRQRDRDRDERRYDINYEGQDRQMNRSPSSRNYLQQEPANISDFSFQPQKIPPQQLQQPVRARGPERRAFQDEQQPPHPKYQPLVPKQNSSRTPSRLQRQGQKPSHPYERHQQLFGNGGPGAGETRSKKPNKENEDIMMIKKEIERSKRIIEEVKRNQMESSSGS